MKEQVNPSVANAAPQAATATSTADDLLGSSSGGLAWRRLLAQGQPTAADLAELLKTLPQSAWTPILLEAQHDPRIGNGFVQQAIQLVGAPASAHSGKNTNSNGGKHGDDLQFGAGEHQDLGATATNGKRQKGVHWEPPMMTPVLDVKIEGGVRVTLAPGYAIPYGDIVALAADHFESIDQMRKFAANNGGGEGSRAEIEYARKWKLDADVGPIDAAAKVAQEARYYRLAAKNQRHFVNPKQGDANVPASERVKAAPDPANDKVEQGTGFHVPPDLPSAIDGYRYYHLRALATAVRAGASKADLNDAYAEEAFGDHFLTDSFSAGHLRTQRNDVAAHWNGKCPMFYYNLKGVLAEAVAKNLHIGAGPLYVRQDAIYDPPVGKGAKALVSEKLDAFGKLGLGDLLSGAIHDYDNLKGVRAESNGEQVTVVGDGQLDKSATGAKTKALAITAVKRGLNDLERAHAAGAKGQSPAEAVAALQDQEGLFAPERMVPRAVADANQGASQMHTLWKFASYDDLLADAQMREALGIFAKEKASELKEALDGFDAEKKKAIETGFLEPLTRDAPAMVRQIINWSPTITDSVLGLKTDDRSNDYYQEAKRTKGGLASLTYEQRERLIDHMLDGVVGGNDEMAIMDILRSAKPAEARRLIAKFGWANLHDKIDNLGGSEFENAFPEAS